MSPTAEVATDKWDAWSNEKTSPQQPAGDVEDEWSKEWETLGDSKAPTSKTAKSRVNQKKAAQRAVRTAAPPTGGKDGEPEPAIANLIDLGGANAAANSGNWDNNDWAEEDAEWQSLNVSTNNQKNVVKRD